MVGYCLVTLVYKQTCSALLRALRRGDNLNKLIDSNILCEYFQLKLDF